MADQAEKLRNIIKAQSQPRRQAARVITVTSGKGGVGKSMVTASLANMMAKKGYRVGILDADITGPSIPKMYGVHGPAEETEDGKIKYGDKSCDSIPQNGSESYHTGCGFWAGKY